MYMWKRIRCKLQKHSSRFPKYLQQLWETFDLRIQKANCSMYLNVFPIPCVCLCKYHKYMDIQTASRNSWTIRVFPKIGVPQNGWFIMKNPIKMDDSEVPLFSETSITMPVPTFSMSLPLKGTSDISNFQLCDMCSSWDEEHGLKGCTSMKAALTGGRSTWMSREVSKRFVK